MAPTESNSEAPETIELFSWWLEGGGRDALYAVLDVHERLHPETSVVNLAEQNSDSARDRLETRMADDDPPDTFQANIGANLLYWVGDNAEDSVLEPLNDLAEDEGWFDVLPEEIVEAASKDGNLYGVPRSSVVLS